MNNQHHARIPEAFYYLSVCNVHLELVLIYWVKKLLSHWSSFDVLH